MKSFSLLSAQSSSKPSVLSAASPWADKASLVADPKYKECSSITERYPGLDGNLLQDRIFSDYLLSVSGDVRLPLLDEWGKPTMKRHALNNRNHAAVREGLVKRIQTKGLVEGVRGQAWAVVGESASEYELISHATLVEALYLAHSRDLHKKNKYVQKSMELGVVAKVFDAKTPSDVLTFLKQLHNEFHFGAQTSHLEMYDLVKDIEKTWREFCRKHKIRARLCPTKGEGTYVKKYWKFIQTHHAGGFKTFDAFLQAKTFVNGMSKIGLLDKYADSCSERCNFAHSSLSMGVVLAANKLLFSTIYESFVDTVPSHVLNPIMLCALRHVYPTVVEGVEDGEQAGDDSQEKGDADHDPLWILNSKESLAAIAICRCPMAGSAVYIRAKKKSHLRAPRSAAGKGKGKANGKNHNRRSLRKQKSDPSTTRAMDAAAIVGNAKAKKRSKIDVKKLMVEEVTDVVFEIDRTDMEEEDDVDDNVSSLCDSGEDDALAVCNDGEAVDHVVHDRPEDGAEEIGEGGQVDDQEGTRASRPKLFLDDLYACVSSVLDSVPDAKWKHDSLQWAYEIAIEFGLAKTVQDPSVSGLTKWSSLRDAIKERLALDHISSLPLTMVAEMNAKAKATVPGKMVDAVKQALEQREKYLSDRLKASPEIDRITKWRSENDLEDPPAMIPAFMAFQTALFQKCMATKKSSGAKLAVDAVIRLAAETWSDNLTPSCTEYNLDFESFAPVVCEIFAMHPERHAIAAAMFTTPQAAQRWAETRVLTTLHAFKQVMTAGVLMERVAAQELMLIEAHATALAAIDVCKQVSSPTLTDASNWAMMWFKCFQCAQASESELTNYIDGEHSAARGRREADKKKFEESACKQAMDQMQDQTTVVAVDRSAGHVQCDESFLEGRISVQASHSKIADLWESFIPKDESDVREFDFKIQSDVRLQVFELAQCEIKSVFARLALDRSSSSCDTCLDSLFVDESGMRPGLFCKEANFGLNLNFFGEVTTIPTIGSFRIGTIDGVSIYVRNNGPPSSKVSFFRARGMSGPLGITLTRVMQLRLQLVTSRSLKRRLSSHGLRNS